MEGQPQGERATVAAAVPVLSGEPHPRRYWSAHTVRLATVRLDGGPALDTAIEAASGSVGPPKQLYFTAGLPANPANLHPRRAASTQRIVVSTGFPFSTVDALTNTIFHPPRHSHGVDRYRPVRSAHPQQNFCCGSSTRP
jgi:hypothetical protein